MTPIESQTTRPAAAFHAAPMPVASDRIADDAAHRALTALEQIGFELGWDHAHHRVAPPTRHAQDDSAFRHGLLAGQAAFGARTLRATPAVRLWLQLRLHAWLQGRSVELIQLTPHYLQQLAVEHCPITRAALGPAGASETSIDRVRNDAGYAAGNLVVMSRKANRAKAAYGYHDALRFVQRLEAAALPGGAGIGGLEAEQWSRVAVLCSYVEPLSHTEAAALPMLLLPPNRMRLFNPVQALQAFVSRQLLMPGWSQRVSRFEMLLAGDALRRDFKAFFMALLPRVLEAGRSGSPQHVRWAIEDAWRQPLVLQRWTAFTSRLDAAQCETLLRKAGARKLATTVIECSSGVQATDGWALETRGFVPHDLPADRLPLSRRPLRHHEPATPAQLCLPV